MRLEEVMADMVLGGFGGSEVFSRSFQLYTVDHGESEGEELRRGGKSSV